jgi:hypothetical protein
VPPLASAESGGEGDSLKKLSELFETKLTDTHRKTYATSSGLTHTIDFGGTGYLPLPRQIYTYVRPCSEDAPQTDAEKVAQTLACNATCQLSPKAQPPRPDSC